MTDLSAESREDRVPVLVLLPGMDGTGIMFRPLIHSLGSRIRTLVVDYPTNLMANYDALMKLVQTRLPDEPFVLLGESFSGPIALKIAAAHPPNLRGVILCASFVRNPFWLLPAKMSWMVRPIVFRVVIALMRWLVDMIDASHSATSKLMAESLAGARAQVWSFRARASMKVDVRRELAACDAPILYLRGEKDVLIANRMIREMQSIQPAMKVERFQAGHLILQTKPMAAARAIEKFLAG